MLITQQSNVYKNVLINHGLTLKISQEHVYSDVLPILMVKITLVNV